MFQRYDSLIVTFSERIGEPFFKLSTHSNISESIKPHHYH